MLGRHLNNVLGIIGIPIEGFETGRKKEDVIFAKLFQKG